MKRILFLVFNSRASDDWIELCVKMLQYLEPDIHILAPVDRHAVTRIALNEGIKQAEVRERLLHEAYRYLYHLEDTFGKKGLHANIAAKELTLPEELLAEIRKSNPGMLVIIGKVETHTFESLHSLLQLPIISLPQEE
jgi:hypothetical protein